MKNVSYLLVAASLVTTSLFAEVLQAPKAAVTAADTVIMIQEAAKGVANEAQMIKAFGEQNGKALFAAISSLRATGELSSSTDFDGLLAQAKTDSLTPDTIVSDFISVSNGESAQGAVGKLFQGGQVSATTDYGATAVLAEIGDPIEAFRTAPATGPAAEYKAKVLDGVEAGNPVFQNEAEVAGRVIIAAANEAPKLCDPSNREACRATAIEAAVNWGPTYASQGEAAERFATEKVFRGFPGEGRFSQSQLLSGFLNAARTKVAGGALSPELELCMSGRSEQ